MIVKETRLQILLFLPLMFPAILNAAEINEPIVTVVGRGEVRQKPDRVLLNVGVEFAAKEIKQAQDENARRTETLMTALKRNGVQEKNIKTTAMQVGPRYDYVNGKQMLREYVASKNFLVQIDDLDQYGRVLEAAMQSGANKMSGVEFDSSHRKELELQALKLAVQDAEKRADTLVQAAGRKRGEALSIESSAAVIPYRPMMLRSAMAADSTNDQVSPGEITITESVTVKYKLQ